MAAVSGGFPSLARRASVSRPQHHLAAVAVALSVTASAFGSEQGGKDVVTIASEHGGQGAARWQGQVLDYTGTSIRMKLQSGIERTFPARRVLRVQTPSTPEHHQGDVALGQGKVDDALRFYKQALPKESRTWVRRQILAQLVRCYRNQDQISLAGDTFLLIVKSDPTTQHMATIPLAWMPGESVSLVKARSWLESTDVPAAALLGASHLLSSQQRDEARPVLLQLTTHADTRIAALATAQIWRVDGIDVDQKNTDQWAEAIARMPESVRAGPYFVLGRTYARQQRWDQAALACMRVPILYPHQRQLAAASLLQTADALSSAGQADDAARLYEQVTSRHGGTRWSTEAKQRLLAMMKGKHE